MSDGLSTLDTSGTIFCTPQPGTSGTSNNVTDSILTAVSQAGNNPLGTAAPLGACLSGLDQSGTGVMGGLSPSTVPLYDANSGNCNNTSCMTSSETNSVTGNTTVGQGPEGLGCNPCDPASLAGGSQCGGIGTPNTGALTSVSDLSDPTDFIYTDNADCN